MLEFSAVYFLKGGSTVLRCVPGAHTGPCTLFTGENKSVYMTLSPESWKWLHVKASKYVDNSQIKGITRLKARSYSIKRPCQQFWTLTVLSEKTFKRRKNLPTKVSSTLGAIFHFGGCLQVWKARCIDRVILRDMSLPLPCNGPRMAVVPMHVCLCLKWCEICGVHDRKPVFAEGGTVHPSQVLHNLREREKIKWFN